MNKRSFEPIRCFLCNNFHGKVAKFCKQKVKCGHCAGDHSLKDCSVKNDETKAKCVNCEQSHPSNDKNCPVYLQLIEKKSHNAKTLLTKDS